MINNDEFTITINQTDCGSYEVKNNQIVIGYAVKPYFVQVDRKKEILNFESALKETYGDEFKNRYRVYTFTTNRIQDTILNAFFFTRKLTESIPNWDCEQQEVDTYWVNGKGPNVITFNCSKNRFKRENDPD